MLQVFAYVKTNRWNVGQGQQFLGPYVAASDSTITDTNCTAQEYFNIMAKPSLVSSARARVGGEAGRVSHAGNYVELVFIK